MLLLSRGKLTYKLSDYNIKTRQMLLCHISYFSVTYGHQKYTVYSQAYRIRIKNILKIGQAIAKVLLHTHTRILYIEKLL